MRAAWLRRHWFLLGLAAAAGLGFAFPEAGVRGGPLRPEITTRAGVALIFFLQGLGLATSALRAGAMRWRLHAAAQAFIFLAFPLGMLVLDLAGGRLLPEPVRVGFLFLAILPTTVSACVVFTAAANGNVAGAVFNSALSNIAGVVITPLWAAAVLSVRGGMPPLGPTIAEIAQLLLVPLALGQLVRPFLGRTLPRATITTIANIVILFIVFAAFAGSASAGAFAEAGFAATAAVVALAAVVLGLATGAAALAGRRLGFDAGDRIALLFCGSQKTLAAGAPMAQVLFAGNPALGLILLPLLAYHGLQLFGAASLVDRLMHRPESIAAEARP